MKLIIFGSTGDLVRRKVIPGLKEINDIEIFALGRKNITTQEYLNSINSYDKRIKYLRIDLDNIPEIFDKENLIYIAMPSEWIIKILKQVIRYNIDFQALIEKPFGNSLNDSLKLKEFIEKNNLTDKIYLSDHYLFKKNAINLKKTEFKKLKIVSIEKIDLGKRIENYDKVGAIKDMIQSHFLNLVFRLIRNKKDLKDIKIIDLEIGQYDDYEKELGRKSDTETYVKIKFKSLNKEFEFISGKAFDRKISYIEVDGKKIDLVEDGNSYKILFEKFIKKEKKFFPSIDDAILAWKIIEEIEKKKVKLKKYLKGAKYPD